MIEKYREEVLEILHQKAALKQDIHFDTLKVFDRFKEVMREEVGILRKKITDQRVRMQYVDKGKFESQIFVGSDMLFFHMHPNVFLLPDGHPFWKLDYLKENPDNGYFGIIYIYNFLAQSVLQNRSEDPGYLISRIFVNREGHFFIEGHGLLGKEFKDVEKEVLSDDNLRTILYRCFGFATQFELLTPPYEVMSEVNVHQIKELSLSLRLKTEKRVGFRFAGEQQEL
ncbi:MAG: hypothetical protein EP338_07395 [Bacteroidetes bacterium]|nr:MAG: hypothetical protein EP338_07395 [Bacteroidota bacterium]